MKLEFFAEYSGREAEDELDGIAKIELLPYYLLGSDKEDTKKEYTKWIYNRQLGLSSEFTRYKDQFFGLDELGFENKFEDMEKLCYGAWQIYFKFSLAKPYISKGDIDLYIIDNPIKKDWVFKLPYIAGTQWKGALRHAFWQNENAALEYQALVSTLFGDERGESTGGRGRLVFYSSFFTDISLEIINPHDEETRAGINPIQFECVPVNSAGVFRLLYLPFDQIGTNKEVVAKEALRMFEFVSKAIEGMMLKYGFGAKTSSGFGVAKNLLDGEGTVVFNLPIAVLEKDKYKLREPSLPDEITQWRVKYPGEEFTMKPLEWKKNIKAGNLEMKEYKRIRALFLEYQNELSEYEKQTEDISEMQEELQSLKTEKNFNSIKKLVELAEHLKGEDR